MSVLGRLRGSLLVAVALLALFGAMVLAACGSPSAPLPTPGAPAPVPTATPIPNRAPVVMLGAALTVDEGYDVTRLARFDDPDDTAWTATVDYGDGTPLAPLWPGADHSFELRHRYTSGGTFATSVSVTDGHGATGVAKLTVDVAPRKIVFVQGIESESRCPGGFASRAPAWVGDYLATNPTLQSELATRPSDLIEFSYSGRYCSGDGAQGQAASYSSGDTCGGIEGADGSAARLRALIERLSPSKVTVLGHSMGGVIALYLAGEDPAWAQQHIASVVAFDSPLGGVPRMNLEVLRLSGAVGGGCSLTSASVNDMQDTNSAVLRLVKAGAAAVPVYSLDATDKEGFLVGIRQAVPGDRARVTGEVLAWSVGASHSGLWSDAPKATIAPHDKRSMVGCALLRLDASSCESFAATP